MNSIIAMTWKEMMRKRVLSLTLIMTAVFLIGFWYVAKTIGSDMASDRFDPSSMEYVLEQFRNGTIILSLGFFFGTFVVAFLSIFSSFSTVGGEAELGVLQALLPRPISRWKWYMGRWIGYVSLGVAYCAILFTALLVITDMYAGVPKDAVLLLKAFALFAWVVPMLVSVAMLGSCFFPAFGNGVFMITLYGAGWLGGMIDKVTAVGLFSEESQQSLNMVSGIMSLVMPADTLQRRMLAELFSVREIQNFMDLNDLGPFSFSTIPSNSFLVYCALYTILALVLGIRAFQRKDL
ncbi:ABC transporter permease subunit [Paenibacillus alkalitolerans]|uniref:ABC transporter permease subunit n=1 Tax=Paenibacillus alkalitolerans TaxID=2799335 RepID=UPI0018F71C83|nr:ABC transporter permease subunit [Paenibacillus alkalitolerans]